MALLDGLDAVDWRRYHHAYGPATDVPGLLRALADPSRAPPTLRLREGQTVFTAVTWSLWGNVFHQGSVWGVTAKVIPFLVEVLEARRPPEVRRFLVRYLHHLPFGYPTDLFPKPFDLEGVEETARKVEAAGLPQAVIDGDAFGDAVEHLDTDAVRNVGAVWVRDCYLGVEAHVERLAAFIDDPDDEVAAGALAVLGSFPRKAALTAPALWTAAREEGARVHAGMALVALAQLGAPKVSEAAQVLADAAPGLTGLYAAVADLLASKGAPSPASQHQLLSAPVEWEQQECPFAGSVGNLVNRALVRLPVSARGAVITALGAALERAKGFGKLDALGALLRVAGVRGGAALDPQARRVVELILAHGDWDKIVNANQAELLRSFGLPDTRDGLAGLLRR